MKLVIGVAVVMAACLPANAAAPMAQIDHIVLGIDDLERGMETFERMTGVRPVYGGKHPYGTHNALASLGDGIYLEILAVQPDIPPPKQYAYLKQLRELTPLGWAVSAKNLAELRAGMAAAGITMPEPQAGSRTTPAGNVLSWHSFDLEEGFSEAPFFLVWSPQSAHPSTTSPPGCTLQRWRVAGRKQDKVERLRRALDLPVEVGDAAATSLHLSLKCPKGSVELDNEPPARVVVVATFHFSNPGRDLNNVASVDVLAPEHQRELARITDALAKFEPTFVGVEWPAALVDERYAQYRAGTLPESRNEVVQLGFRLAKQGGLERVHGLDVNGDFPFEAVQTWAREHGRQGAIDALMAEGQREVQTITAKQASGLAAALRYLNEPASIARNHAFYPAMLKMGQGDQQPGAKLLAAWYARNLEICARLVQSLKPGDRAVVFYGQGHAYLLNQCLDEASGVERVDPLEFLAVREEARGR